MRKHGFAGVLMAPIVLVAGCSSGGGGGGTPAVQLGFAEGTSTTPEGSAIQVPLVLRLTTAALAEDLTVMVTDVGTGTATQGSDYTFADQLVSFAAGSTDGATQLVTLTPTNDSLVEGSPETVRLALSGQSAGKLKGSKHTLTIDESDLATIGFSVAASATPDESAGTHAVTVELQLDPGDALGVDVSATLSDAGSGSASGGSDYAAFAPQNVVFPAGSANGASVDFSITLMSDFDVEGDETVVFALDGASVGAEVDGAGTHVVTITEDDLGDEMIEVRIGGSSITGGESIALGSGVDVGDLGPGVALELMNLGGEPIDLGVLQLTGDTTDFQIEAPDSALPQLSATPEVGSFPLAASGSGGLALAQVDRAWLQSQEHVVLHGVPLPGGGDTSIELWRLPSPWREDARIVIDGRDLEGGAEALLGETNLWRGSVVGEPESKVFLAFSDHGSRGWIRPGHGSAGEVLLLADRDAQTHAVWSATLAPEGGPELCGGVREVPGAVPQDMTVSEVQLGQSLSGVSAASGDGSEVMSMGSPGVSWSEASIAIETDFQLYEKFGSTSALTDYVTQLMAAISDVYERDVQARLTIAYLGVHTSASDGWETQESGGNAGDLLDEFQAAWGSSWPADADLAHFLSGASLGGGVAYVNVLCNKGWGFGVSAGIHGLINWDTFNGSSGGLNWDFVVVAHELGHNFGTGHTHNYCPPLDLCYDNCEDGDDCPNGTIMSYCHVCGGMSNIDLEFHPHVAQVMRERIAASCLGDSELQPGASANFTLRFAPTSGAGSKSCALEINHGAINLPSPLSVNLTGQAVD